MLAGRLSGLEKQSRFIDLWKTFPHFKNEPPLTRGFRSLHQFRKDAFNGYRLAVFQEYADCRIEWLSDPEEFYPD